ILEEYIESTILNICTDKQIRNNIYKLILKEFNKGILPENKKIQKITTKLYTNGYSFDIIKDVFSQFLDEKDSRKKDKDIIE
ncbi:RecX family transcriptional regulator, partial [Streptococcus danieliae]|nr:RecX family transcriptional regulator [Streptococcus danieliae]